VLFKSDYLALTGVNSATYTTVQTAVSRIQELFETARRGKISTAVATHLWTQFFSPHLSQFPTVPLTQQLYDTFATTQILALAGILRQHKRGDFGIAQKMFNLFMKDHWALNTFSPQLEIHLHLPLDRGLIYRVGNMPQSWAAWTKVAVTPTTLQQIVADYLRIQTTYRSYWQRITSATQCFASPLEMEELLWQQI
jgi:hypothetical protein